MKMLVCCAVLLIAGFSVADSDKIKVEDYLFTVECANGGRGSAFLMKDDDGVWMVSNYHVVSSSNHVEFISMNNKERKLELPAEVEIANDRDAVRFRVKEETGFCIASGCEFDDAVYAFGNSGGLGVVTKSKGSVVGKGRSDIEVSCEIIPGNSGGPVINDNGNVLGIASYIVKPAVVEFSKDKMLSSNERERLEEKLKEVKGTRYEDTRRFAIPLKDAVWQVVPLETFQEESSEFYEQRKIYSRMYDIINKVMAFKTIPETAAGEPFLDKQWIRQYNKNVVSLCSVYDGYIHIRGDKQSFFRQYGRTLIDLHGLLQEGIDAQQEAVNEKITIKYISQELKERAESASATLEKIKTLAEEYKR